MNSREQTLGAIERGEVRARTVVEAARLRRRRARRAAEHGTGEHQVLLNCVGKRADDVYAGDVQQLADLLHGNLALAFGDSLAGEAGGRDDGPGVDLRRRCRVAR